MQICRIRAGGTRAVLVILLHRVRKTLILVPR